MNVYRIGPETARLRLRAMSVEDAPAFFELNSHPDVVRYTGEPALRSVEDAWEAIASYPDFDTVGYGRWGCYLKDSGALVGFCGLKNLSDLGEVDLGYRLLPQYWGMGLATEAARPCVAFGFDVLGLERIIGLVVPENAASIRVLEKVGMWREGEIEYLGDRVLRYVIGLR